MKGRFGEVPGPTHDSACLVATTERESELVFHRHEGQIAGCG